MSMPASPALHHVPRDAQRDELRALVAPLLSLLESAETAAAGGGGGGGGGGEREAAAWAFARERGAALAGMSVSAKAALCRSLHLRAVRGTGAPTADPFSARALQLVSRLLEATRGAELTALKLALDVTEPASSLHHDLLQLARALAAAEPAAGERLAAHVRRQAPAALAQWRAAPARAGSWPIKLFCDFDDTMAPRLFDYSFPASAPYPGVGAFLLALIGAAHEAAPPRSQAAAAGAHYLRPAVDSGNGAAGACQGMGLVVRTREQRAAAAQVQRGVPPRALASSAAAAAAAAAAASRTEPAERRRRRRRRQSWHGLLRIAAAPLPALQVMTAASSQTNLASMQATALRVSSPGAVVRSPQQSQSQQAIPQSLVVLATPRKAGAVPAVVAQPRMAARRRSASCSDAAILLEAPAWASTPKARGGASDGAEARRKDDAAVMAAAAVVAVPVAADTVAPAATPASAAEAAPQLSPPPPPPPHGAGRSSVGGGGVGIVRRSDSRGGSSADVAVAAAPAADLPPAQLSGLVFLSARPAMLKESTYHAAVGILGGVARPRAILCGTLLTSITNASMAAKKAENFAAYAALYPEFRVVWLGDSGQGDIAAGLHMIELHAAWRREAEASAAAAVLAAAAAGAPEGSMAAELAWLPPPPLVLIHDICGSSQRPSVPPLARATWRARGIHIFDSYVEAAAICYEAGILAPALVRSVIDAATAGLSATTFASERQRLARLEEFSRAVARCRPALIAAGES